MEMPVTAAPGTWATNLCSGTNTRAITLQELNKILREYGAFNAPSEGDEGLATKTPNMKKISMAILLTMLWQELKNEEGNPRDAMALWPMGKAWPPC